MHDQPTISEATTKAAAALAAAATGLVASGTPSDAQRAEASRLLRTAADMLTPARGGGSGPVCRCAGSRSVAVTHGIGERADRSRIARAVAMANPAAYA